MTQRTDSPRWAGPNRWSVLAARAGCVVVLLAALSAIVYQVQRAGLRDSAIFAGLFLAMGLLAASILAGRDRARYRRWRKRVGATLMSRDDLPDDAFHARFPGYDASLIADTRRAIAEWLGVPPGKIHPDDRFSRDYEADDEFAIQCAVIARVLTPRLPEGWRFVAPSVAGYDIEQLLEMLQRVLDEASPE